MNELITQAFLKFPLLIPNHNFTKWNGYISCSKEQELLISVVCPKFPSLEGTMVRAPTSLAVSPLQKTTLQNIIRGANSFLGLLGELQIFFASLLPNETPSVHKDIQASNKSNVFESARDILAELTDKVGLDALHSLSGDLKKLILLHIDDSEREHRLELKIPSNYPKDRPEILSIDLPEAVQPQFAELHSISDFYQQFTCVIQSLQGFWQACDTLRMNVNVLEPRDPMFKDTVWRIAIANDVFASLILNPLEVQNCPIIRIVGNRKDSLEFEAILEKNLKELEWDSERDLLDNLGRLLEITEFPPPVEEEDERIADSQLFQAQECCICFTSRADDNSAPHKYCNNEKCNAYFHYGCLLEWFQSLPTGEVCDSDFISGDCLNCGCKILCPAQK
ncbi:unnamed protein product [Bemisia tabaci]|uniref:E3 ubiquitin-protein ligase FANCL n=1 Tax=Bemisia tabaci TaxID=7038 RepID=A0A9P0F4G3_BEMTA|nr:unnamed protein product [Bemisia tabaci]